MKDVKLPDLKETFQLHFKGVKLIHQLCPKLYIAIGLAALSKILFPYAALYLSARIINELAGMRRPEVLMQWIWIMILTETVLGIAKSCFGKLKTVQYDLFHIMRRQLYTKKMLFLDYADVDKQETADLYAQVTQNETNMGWGLCRLVQDIDNLFLALCQVFGAIMLTVSLFTSPIPSHAGSLTILNHPFFILIFLAAMYCLMKFNTYTASRIDQKWTEESENNREANRLATYYGFKVCKPDRALDIRIYEQDKLSEHYHEKVDSVWGLNSIFGKWLLQNGGILDGLSRGFQALFTGIIYAFVCLKALVGAFGIGSITQYIGAITALQQGLSQLFSGIEKLRINIIYLRDSFAFLDIPNTMYQGTLPTEKRTDCEYDVEFRDVSFQYPGSELWALRQVNMRFKVGNRLAIVGENGSGKTTFIKLLCRLYDPTEGQILLNGIDIRKYNYREYMDLFSVVFQDFQLLSQPLGSNIAGSKEYDSNQVRQCLIDAGFDERLQIFPNGLETQLYKEFSENGIAVSGGEAQKIAIARALYRDAPFIILDEPTAALDPIAEAEIYAKFNDITGDKTAIYISHRLSSCKFCDEIAVFHDGTVIQHGTHAELLANSSGKYYELWNAQAQYYI